MKKKVTTLSDVATEAGVSKSTVSRVLNNKLGNGFSVKNEIKQKVLDTAKKLSYHPNLTAKSLTLQNSRMIHIIGGHHALSDLGNIDQTVVNSATKNLEIASDVFDATVDMSFHKPDATELPAWKVDGVIVLAKGTPVTMKELESMAIPYVVVNGPCGQYGSSVVPDDIAGTQAAIKHLIGLGHKRIAYAQPFGPPLKGHSSIRDRHQTYLSELEKNGLKPVDGHENFFEVAEDFINQSVINNGATGILAYGHMGGLNLMQAAHRLNISIPGNLSIICFCDEYAANVMSPGLTFVDMRSEEMGKIAAEKLLKKINDPKNNESEIIKLEEKLVIRNSTARID